jgi:TRAP-type C4-dicarboxylate transport system permease small subunit
MKTLRGLLDCMTNVLSGLAGLAMVLMMLHVTADVIIRLVLRAPLDGTQEIVSHYYMIALFFLPLALVERQGGHIAAELFTDFLSRRSLLLLEGIIGIFMAMFLALLTWQFVVQALAATQRGETSISATFMLYVWPSRWFLPIGCGVMAAYALLIALVRFVNAGASLRAAAGGLQQEEHA